MVTLMGRTHERRRMSIFSGPPGIGKTSAIDAFVASNEDHVAVVKVSGKNVGDRIAFQNMVRCFNLLQGKETGYLNPDSFSIRRLLASDLRFWACLDRKGEPLRSTEAIKSAPLFTFVFDEAQNLSRHAIDALRCWNDPDRHEGPFPIGVIFIGNDEFSLKADRSGTSIISAAVADRALYQESFDYGAVKDSDLQLFIKSRGVTDPNAIAAIVRRYRSPRIVRSFRRLSDDLDSLIDEADGAQVTLATVQAVFNP